MNKITSLSRREFLKTTGLAGSGLLLGLSGTTLVSTADSGTFGLPPFISIEPDGSIHIGMPGSEMGQGIHTTLASVLADELEIRMDQITSLETIHHPAFNNQPMKYFTSGVLDTQMTGGSITLLAFFGQFRKMGAAAREMLRLAAAEQWGTPIDQCRAAEGKITNTQSGESLEYGVLAGAAAALAVPEDPPLKSPDKFRLIGKPVARVDTPAKIDGSAVYGTDVDLPGMLYGAVRHCPVFGSKISGIDDTAAKAIPGVVAVIPLENLVIVVATNTWIAMQGADALVIKATGGDASFGDADIDTRIEQSLNAPDPGAPVAHEGDADQAISSSDATMEFEYAVSLQAHATMEPPCATAQVTDEGCDVWAPTQTQGLTAMIASMVTELPPEKIRIHTTYLGGGFGRKSSPDFVVPALIAAKATGRPVKVTWSRTEDIQHDHYLPPFRVRLNAGLDADGVPRALSVRLAGPSTSVGMVPLLGSYFPPWMEENGFDWATCVGMFDFTSQAGSYAVPDLKVDYVMAEIPVPVGFWRSVGTVHNAFALESAMDEIAQAHGIDPIDLRRELLQNNPRALRVLDRVQEVSGWGGALPEGHYQGMGYIYYLDCYQAQVAEISVDNRGRTRVHRVTCVIDCGQAINPAIVDSQIQGAIIYGLSGTLNSRINIEKGRVVQGNFDDYPLPKLKTAPVIDVHIINSGEQPGGIGEAGTPLVGPAVANAVFAATGKRVRRLPIKRSDLA